MTLICLLWLGTRLLMQLFDVRAFSYPCKLPNVCYLVILAWSIRPKWPLIEPTMCPIVMILHTIVFSSNGQFMTSVSCVENLVKVCKDKSGEIMLSKLVDPVSMKKAFIHTCDNLNREYASNINPGVISNIKTLARPHPVRSYLLPYILVFAALQTMLGFLCTSRHASFAIIILDLLCKLSTVYSHILITYWWRLW